MRDMSVLEVLRCESVAGTCDQSREFDGVICWVLLRGHAERCSGRFAEDFVGFLKIDVADVAADEACVDAVGDGINLGG